MLRKYERNFRIVFDGISIKVIPDRDRRAQSLTMRRLYNNNKHKKPDHLENSDFAQILFFFAGKAINVMNLSTLVFFILRIYFDARLQISVNVINYNYIKKIIIDVNCEGMTGFCYT